MGGLRSRQRGPRAAGGKRPPSTASWSKEWIPWPRPLSAPRSRHIGGGYAFSRLGELGCERGHARGQLIKLGLLVADRLDQVVQPPPALELVDGLLQQPHVFEQPALTLEHRFLVSFQQRLR